MSRQISWDVTSAQTISISSDAGADQTAAFLALVVFRTFATRARSIFRPQDYDLSDTATRSKDRYRRIVFGAGTSVVARGIAIVVSLFMVPLTLHYLGAERYGMWLTMTSVVSLLTLTDLGIGNGLVNALAEAEGRDDRLAAGRYTSSAVAALLGVAAMLGLLFSVVYPFVPWGSLFNVKTPQAIEEAGPAVAVLTICFLVSLPLGVVARVRVGLQEGYIDSSWAIAGSVVSLVAVIVSIRLGLGLPWLALAIAGLPLLLVVVNGVSLFKREHPWLSPSVHSVSRDAVRRVMSVGIYFFVLQTAAAVAYQSDSIVVAQIMGSAAVPQYAVPMKLFMIIPLVMSFVLNPIWPAYREAMSRGDHDWVHVTFRRSLLVSLSFSIPAALALVLVGRPLIHLWVGESITAAPLLMIGLGCWAVVAAVGGAASTFLTAMGILRPLAVLATLMMMGNVTLSVVLTRTIGVSGVIYGSLVAQALFVALPATFLVRRELRRLPSSFRGVEVKT